MNTYTIPRYRILGVHFNVDDPNERAKLSDFINGIKQYQDEEYKSMRANFERVENLLADDNELNAKKSGLLATRSLPGERLQLQDRITENQPQFVTRHGNTDVVNNHNRYVKWALVFVLILFFGATIKVYLGRFAGNVFGVLELLQLKRKN